MIHFSPSRFTTKTCTSHQQSAGKQGSTLVLTLLVISLMLVITLSLVIFVRLELRKATNRQELMEARGNARLGLQIALAELQSAAGPDQRSVARTNVMHQHDLVNGQGATFPPSVNTASNSRGYWLGVSHSDGSSPVNASYNPVTWLVSGLNQSQTPAQQLTAGPRPGWGSTTPIMSDSVSIIMEMDCC